MALPAVNKCTFSGCLSVQRSVPIAWTVLQTQKCPNTQVRFASKSSKRLQKRKAGSGNTNSKDGGEEKQLIKLYPNAKGILNNLVSQATRSDVKKFLSYTTTALPKKKKSEQEVKRSVLALTWPQEMTIEGVGSRKKDAENMAAAQACAKLKELGLLDSQNHPVLPDQVMYKKEEIAKFLRVQNQPDIIELNPDVKTELIQFVQRLQETKDQDEDEAADEPHLSFVDMLASEELQSPVVDVISDQPYQRLSPSKRDMKSGILLQRLVNRGTNRSVAAIQQSVNQLPINAKREELLSVIAANQVTVVCGETGCGKTTQVPQYILDDWIRQGAGAQCNMVITQPRRISAISTSERVAKERGEKVGQTVGYQIRLQRRLPEPHGCMLVCTTGILLKKLQQNPDLKGISHVIVDEVHERDINTDFLLVLLKSALTRNPDVRLILMSASINPGLFSEYFDKAPIVNVLGFMYPVEEFFLPEALADLGIDPNKHKSPLFEAGEEEKEKTRGGKRKKKDQKAPPTNEDLVVDVIRQIDKKKPPGAVLCFLPGWQDIRNVFDKLTEAWGTDGKHVVHPVHSHVTMDNQQAMFETPPEGVRKVVLATNIAETSITIPDVVYVVNTGTHKEERFDSDLGVSCLDLHWTSKANITQRRGRAGRRQPGQCFHLFGKDVYNKMSEFQTAEMLRIPLEQLVVQAKVHNEAMRAEEFLAQAIEPPPPQAVSAAIDLLQDLSILDSREGLTPLGRKISTFGCDPKIAKAVVFSSIFRCVDPVLTIAASLCIRDPFRETMDNRKLIQEKMQEFCGGSESDHLMRLAVYRGWEESGRQGRAPSAEYARSNHLYPPTLQFIRGLRRQFALNLEESDMILTAESCFDPSARCNEYREDAEIIKAVLCSAFYPNLLKARQGRHEKGKLKLDKVIFKDLDSNRVLIHRRSVNCTHTDLSSKWLAYFSKIRSDAIFVRDCSVVPSLAVIAFAGLGNVMYLEKLSTREKRDVQSRGLPAGLQSSGVVKLLIADQQAVTAEEDGGDFSPWEGFPITFYARQDTAQAMLAFVRALYRMIDRSLMPDACFMPESTRAQHGAILSLFCRLLRSPSAPPRAERGASSEVTGGFVQARQVENIKGSA